MLSTKSPRKEWSSLLTTAHHHARSQPTMGTMQVYIYRCQIESCNQAIHNYKTDLPACPAVRRSPAPSTWQSRGSGKGCCWPGPASWGWWHRTTAACKPFTVLSYCTVPPRGHTSHSLLRPNLWKFSLFVIQWSRPKPMALVFMLLMMILLR